MKYKRVLVTGGTGLLGRSIVSLLTKNKYRVTVLDIFKRDINGATVIQGDFCNVNLMKFLLKDIDAVIHLAAMLGVDNCRLHPEEVIRVNYKDTKLFIDLCVKANIKKFVFTSSSEVYGNTKKLPYREEGPLSPISTYAKAKVMVEKYLKKVQEKTHIKVGISRLFNVYGFNQNLTFVIPIFIEACFKNKPLTIFGDGKQTRCFTYVGDTVHGLVKLLEYDKTPFEIINIGRDQEYTMEELAKIILKNIPESRSKIKYLKYGEKNVRDVSLEIMRRVPAIEKAKKILGFEAKTSLEKGIKKIIKEWREYYTNLSSNAVIKNS